MDKVFTICLLVLCVANIYLVLMVMSLERKHNKLATLHNALVAMVAETFDSMGVKPPKGGI